MIRAIVWATLSYIFVLTGKRSKPLAVTFAALIKTAILNLVRIFLFLLVSACAISCVERANKNDSPGPIPGAWEIVFDVGKARIPVVMTIDSSGLWNIHNDGEVIPLRNLTLLADSFHVKLPLFQTFLHGRLENDSTLSGFLHDPTRSADYKIPFRASRLSQEVPLGGEETSFVFDCTFSPADTAEMYKAVGIFKRVGQDLTGTFLTETGDYRYLAGKMEGDSLQLSCFDGAHLFFFRAAMKGDSIVGGTFFSGKHWDEPWNGRLDPGAHIRDPESLTTLIDGADEFNFRVQNLEGDSVSFDTHKLEGKVTVVQIMGSWCPNCTDESLLLKQLYEKYSSLGLQIIPVGFERSENPEQNARVLGAQWEELDMPYPVYLGAGKGKSKAEETFPMLNHVMSFPTCLFIDKSGVVRKIHTGFYGPGTGDYYYSYAERIELYIKQLLDEPN
jgi:thiol-disulfide isomerase/thioredoxin